MSFSLRQATLCVSALLAVSLCFAQPFTPHDSGETPSSSVLDSSSRDWLDAASAAAPEGSPAGGAVVSQRPAYTVTGSWFFRQFGAGAFVSPLGIGVGAATSLTRSVNLRVAGNFFNYNATGTTDGVSYKGALNFRSVQASFDWFPWHKSFHLSPGVLFYDQNQIAANGGVPAGDSFSVKGAPYYSGAADPVNLYAHVAFRHTAPMLTVGWSNWLPREREKHLSIPIDIGFAYTDEPPLVLTFAGVVCDSPHNGNCRSIDSDPTVQQNIDAQRTKYQNDLDYIRFYPVISTGVTYKF
jgi:hypothetical protein